MHLTQIPNALFLVPEALNAGVGLQDFIAARDPLCMTQLQRDLKLMMP